MSNLSAEVLTCLESQPLSMALAELQSFAIAQNEIALADWASRELYGYASDNFPEYRIITLKYFDASGQAIPDLSLEYGSWPLANGIQKLEAHTKHGLTLKLPVQVKDFLSQFSCNEIFGGYVEPAEIKQVISAVRSEAELKLRSLASNESELIKIYS